MKKGECKHDRLRFSITGDLHCNSCNSKWRDGQAVRILLGKVEYLEKRIEAIEEYQMERLQMALLELGMESCDRCGEFFKAEPNPKGVRYRQSETSPENAFCCICRDCLVEAAENENCTWWDDDSAFAKQQVAQWWILFYGSEKPQILKTPDRHGFNYHNQSQVYHLINTEIAEIVQRGEKLERD